MTDHSVFMHEIKNCLSNIYSLIELAENYPENFQEYTNLVKASITQIKRIESDYDEYRNSGKSPIKFGSVNLSELLQSLVEEYKSSANDKKINIQIEEKYANDSHTTNDIRIFTDAVKLRQVLTNLLTNAIKYNIPEGQIYITCKVLDNKKVAICIRDTGIGMNKEELRKLGTAFYRSKKVDVEGTGLGWTLIKSIVNLMDWNIQIKSNVRSTQDSGGTCVTIEI